MKDETGVRTTTRHAMAHYLWTRVVPLTDTREDRNIGSRYQLRGGWAVYCTPGWEGHHGICIDASDGDCDQLLDDIFPDWTGNPDIDVAIWAHEVERWCRANLPSEAWR